MRIPSVRLSLRAILKNFILSPRTTINRLFKAAPILADDLEDVEYLRKWTEVSGNTNGIAGREGVLMMASFLPLAYSIKLEGMIGRAMQARGFRVVVVTNLPSRKLVEAYHGAVHGFEITLIEDYLGLTREAPLEEDLASLLSRPGDVMERVRAYRYRNVFIGQHALATLSASVVDGRLDLCGSHRSKLRKILKLSTLFVDAAYRVLEKYDPKSVLGVEKGFVGTAELFYASMNRKIGFVQWVACPEPNSIMLKRYNLQNFRDHPSSLSVASWKKVLAMPWGEQQSEQLLRLFERGYKEGVWFKHTFLDLTGDQYQRDRSELIERLHLDPAKKTAVIYSHILNDANLFYGKDLFTSGFEEWLIETVRAAAENPNVNWVLKVHPANVFRNAKLGYTGRFGEVLALERAFGAIPEFLRLAYPEEKISPLSFYKVTDYGITVRGTVGLELPCFGIPTLTAGTGRYSGKGFTIDSESKEEYLDKIRNIHHIPRLTDEQKELGQRYAYYIFSARPARYNQMFEDRYNFPVKHHRYRDISQRMRSLSEVLHHPQMLRITDFLCSQDEDFLDFESMASDSPIALPRKY